MTVMFVWIGLHCNRFILYPLSTMSTKHEPATKADLDALRETLQGEMALLSKTLLAKMVSTVEEMKRQFEVVAEHNRFELLGALSDRIVQLMEKHADHEVRIYRLEQRTGVVV